MKTRTLFSALFSTALLLAACGDDDEGGDTPDMAPAEDAGLDGGACFSGAADSPVNGACNCQGDCTTGTTCEAEGTSAYPQGICAAACTPGGEDSCGPAAVCRPVPGIADFGTCVDSCASNADCRDGWACLFGVCDPLCTRDDQCLTGTCNLYTGFCGPIANPDAGGVLAACTRREDCRSDLCHDAIGYCATFCSVEIGGCPEEAHCIGVDPADPGAGLCMPRCETSADCEGGLECLNTGDGRQVCWIRAT